MKHYIRLMRCVENSSRFDPRAFRNEIQAVITKTRPLARAFITSVVINKVHSRAAHTCLIFPSSGKRKAFMISVDNGRGCGFSSKCCP